MAFDPRLATLKTLKQDMPMAWMRALAKDGPTTATRRQAVTALRGDASPDTVAVLEAIATGLADKGWRISSPAQLSRSLAVVTPQNNV